MVATLTRDLLMNLLLGLVALVVLVLAQVNPASPSADLTPPGNLIASISWPAGDTDVDLWVSAPDNLAVGFSNKTGRIWSLLRDDQGMTNDTTPLNFEAAFTRGLPDGEYAVNVRCYRCLVVPLPIAVDVRLADGSVVYRGTTDMLKDGQERTAIRFRVEGGRVLQDSANQVFKPMNRKAQS